MKVITECVIDMSTGATLHEESYEYEGPVAQCGGGGGGGKSAPSAPAAPAPEQTPTYETEKEPLAKSVRDSEQRKIVQRTGLAGTILTSPLGATGTSGSGGSNLLGA